MHIKDKAIKKIKNLDECFSRILAIGPHPDDIELGCYGAITKFKKMGSEVQFLVLTSGGIGGSKKTREAEAKKSAGLIGAKISFANLPDTKVSDGFETISKIEKLVKDFKPTAVFINSKDDTHQDHRNAAKAAISACRFVPAVLFYQTPSSNRSFNPTFYINITEVADKKIEAVKIHKSQGENVYMADSAVKGLAQFLGFQIYQGGELYEAFELHQIIV